jgi:ribosomal protein S27E
MSDERMILPPIDVDEGSVIQLKVPFKKPIPEDRFLLADPPKCSHFGPFAIDQKATEVTCKKCGEKVSPMYVLHMLAMSETRWHEAQKRYQDEMKRLNERNRTKCQHCSKMTRIER